LLEPLEATITGEFIPAITGRSVGELERKLFSLPVRLGGFGLASPSVVAGFYLMHPNLLCLLCPLRLFNNRVTLIQLFC